MIFVLDLAEYYGKCLYGIEENSYYCAIFTVQQICYTAIGLCGGLQKHYFHVTNISSWLNTQNYHNLVMHCRDQETNNNYNCRAERHGQNDYKN